MPSSITAHTPIRSRTQGRALTCDEMDARDFAFDVVVAAQYLTEQLHFAGYRYNERRARAVQFEALDFLEALDELVGV